MCDKCQEIQVSPINIREYKPLTEEAIARGMQALNQLALDRQKGNKAITVTAISHDQPSK